MWISLDTAGSEGTEGGVIIADEEYNGACRITLEKCKRWYAITCGVYGAMCHTAFTNADTYRSMYNDMKNELQQFIDTETTEDEESDFYHRFCDKY
ncbi:MAG: hypothetical protein K6C68_10315 [Ruminococcus sp.]|nr:hypothetical protein [Ruminococcus sp.]